MEYLEVTPESIKKAAEVLRGGGIVAFPTETVYGLGADAYNTAALVKVFEAKGRPRFDPLIVHIAALDTLKDVANLSLLTEEVKQKLILLTENFWPGPLSIILPKSEKIPGIATAGLDTVAVRFPSHEVAQKLIALSGSKSAGGAVAAPSANPFGAISPTRAKHVLDGLGEKVDIILDGGSTLIGIESTVLDITSEQVRILRHGGTSKEAIEETISGVLECTHAASNGTESISSPGQLKSHYAPSTPLKVFNKADISNLKYDESAAFLFFDEKSKNEWGNSLAEIPQNAAIRVLSPFGNTSEAAARLFETLHELDRLRVSLIFAQQAPQAGLGSAINDRLNRASY